MSHDETTAVSARRALTGFAPADRLLRLVEWAGMAMVAVAMLVILVFTLGQVLDRHFLKGVFNAYEQIAQMGLVWLTFVGMAMALREGANIVVDLIDKFLPPRVVAVKLLVLDILSVVVMGLLVSYGLRLVTIGSYQIVMGTPFTYASVYAGLVTGSVMIVLFLLVRIVMAAIGLVAGSGDNGGHAMIFVAFGVFFLLLLAGLDIGISMISAALIGMFISGSVNPAVAGMTLVTSIDSAALLTVPLFVLAAEIMSRGGILMRLVSWSSAMIGHFRGSLSQVAILTNLIMAGISGSAAADAAATGGMLIPAMRKEGYKPGYPSAVIAAGAMLGPILPPSIPLVVYAVLSNVSIARLFIAAIVPGFVLAAGYMVICAIIARRRNYAAYPKATWRGRAGATRHAFWALLMPVCIVGGVRSGVFTDSEAGGVICLYAFIVCLLIYGDMRLGDVPRVIYKAGRTSAVVLFLLAASGPFTWLMNETRVAQAMTGGILSVSTDPTTVLVVIALLLFVVGMVIEPLPGMVMFLPTLIPIQAQLGIDPIHFAMVVSLTLMLGMVTPPVGTLLFVVNAIGREPIGAVVMESLPFVAWMSALIVLIIFFPGITTWLPSVAF